MDIGQKLLIDIGVISHSQSSIWGKNEAFGTLVYHICADEHLLFIVTWKRLLFHSAEQSSVTVSSGVEGGYGNNLDLRKCKDRILLTRTSISLVEKFYCYEATDSFGNPLFLIFKILGCL